MRLKNDKLILDQEMTDSMAEDLIIFISTNPVDTIVIKTIEISSAVMQVLFCLSKEKQIICKEPFLEKFFEKIEFQH